MNHNFNEKTTEYSSKQKTQIPVIQSDKYYQSKKKAIEIIEKYDDIEDSDFWILMNETKTGKMMYFRTEGDKQRKQFDAQSP